MEFQHRGRTIIVTEKGTFQERDTYTRTHSLKEMKDLIDQEIANSAPTGSFTLQCVNRVGETVLIKGVHKGNGQYLQHQGKPTSEQMYPDHLIVRRLLDEREAVRKDLDRLNKKLQTVQLIQVSTFRVGPDSNTRLQEDYNAKMEVAKELEQSELGVMPH